jgi:uncharacterized membrane protein
VAGTTTEPTDAKSVSRLDRLARAGDVWLGRRDPQRWVLGSFMAAWTLTFTMLTWQRQDGFGTFGFDLGIWDQAIWLLSRFKDPFITVRGLNLFGFHLSPILFPLVPFYWLGAGPHFLLVVQAVAQASGAIAVFLLARDRLHDRWLAVVLAAALLVHPTSGWLVWEFFHPDALAIAPMLFAYWAARSARWGWFAVAAVLAVACKEDVALSLFVLGVLVAFRGHRRAGVVTAAASLAWFELGTRVILPAGNGVTAFQNVFFGEWGNSQTEIIVNVLRKPGRVVEMLSMNDRKSYLTMLLAPVGFVALAAPSVLLIGVPMLAINLLSALPFQREIRYHYAALVLVAVIIATVEAIAKFNHRPGVRRFLVGLVAASSLSTAVAWGNSPLSVKFHQGYWANAKDARRTDKAFALSLIPPGEATSAAYFLVPHLSHRDKIYEFPVPWKPVNWGVNGENLQSSGDVKWLILDLQILSPDDKILVQALLRTQFVLRYGHDGILVAQRIAAPPPQPPTPARRQPKR